MRHEAYVLASARSEGRSNRLGEPALYLSSTPEGCRVATRAWRTEGDPLRGIFPVRVTSRAILDLRDPVATKALGVDTTHRAAAWKDWRAKGEDAPTWAISDRLRALGLDGMLYQSRTVPDLTHLTLLRWNTPDSAVARVDGEPIREVGS